MVENRHGNFPITINKTTTTENRVIGTERKHNILNTCCKTHKPFLLKYFKKATYQKFQIFFEYFCACIK